MTDVVLTRSNGFSGRDIDDAVASTFDRLDYPFNDGIGGGLVEGGGDVHRDKGGDYFEPVLQRLNRTVGTFVSANGFVGIEPHNQQVAFPGGGL